MRVVVPIAGMRLAVMAEVSVMADSTLVADALNVGNVLLVPTQGTVAVDTIVAVTTVKRLGQRLIDGHKAMARVDVLGAFNAVGAIVPVWAVQALVTDTIDEFVAPIAYG
jgi:hypothetical protein